MAERVRTLVRCIYSGAVLLGALLFRAAKMSVFAVLPGMQRGTEYVAYRVM